MFLTTDRVTDINDAIQSRISVALRCRPLRFQYAKVGMGKLLEEAAIAKGRTRYTLADLDWLSNKDVNGRQVRGCINIHEALLIHNPDQEHNNYFSVDKGVSLSRSHSEGVIGLDDESQKDYNVYLALSMCEEPRET